MDSLETTEPQISMEITLRTVKQSIGMGAFVGMLSGAGFVEAFAFSSGPGPLLLGAVIGAVAGLLFGLMCAVPTSIGLALGAQFFTAHVWTARLFTGMLNGGLLAGLTLLLTNGHAGDGQLPAVSVAFTVGALLGGYSAGYVVTGRSCTVLRKLLTH